jgi:hypothetical protein
VRRRKSFKWANYATDLVTQADLGKTCYIVDAVTVAKTNGTPPQRGRQGARRGIRRRLGGGELTISDVRFEISNLRRREEHPMIINQANLTGIYKSFSTIFNQAFAGASSLWGLVAMLAPSAGASVDYKWLGDFPMMREWIGERHIKDLSAFKYEIANKDFESTIEVDRNHIQDDQIGVYTPMIQGLAQAARQHPDLLIFALLKAGFSALLRRAVFSTPTTRWEGRPQLRRRSGEPWF